LNLSQKETIHIIELSRRSGHVHRKATTKTGSHGKSTTWSTNDSYGMGEGRSRQVVNPNTKTLPLISQSRELNQYAAIWIPLSPFSGKPGEDVEVMQNQTVHERNRYSAHFDIRGRVKAIHYDLTLKRENDKFLLSDKQLAPVVGTNWKRTWDYVHAPGYYNNDGQVRRRNQQRWKDIKNSDGICRNKNGVQKLEQHILRDLVHLTVKDKDVDAEYLGVSRMRKERKQATEIKKAMLEQVRNTERFQNEAAQRDRVMHAQLIVLKGALKVKDLQLAEKDKEIDELQNRPERAINSLHPHDMQANNPRRQRTPDDDRYVHRLIHSVRQQHHDRQLHGCSCFGCSAGDGITCGHKL
jgi:hypothetical protein